MKVSSRSTAEARRVEPIAIADRLESQSSPARLFALATVRHGVLQTEAALAWTDEAGTLMKRALVEEMAPWGNARGIPIIVVSRVLSVLSAIPAFFVDEAPDWAPPVVGVGIVVTIAAIALIYSGQRKTELPSY